MYFDDGQTLFSFGPHYANEGLFFKDEGRGWKARVICLREDFVQPGSHMPLINGLMDRQQSGVK